MPKTETLQEFYQHKMNWLPDNLQQEIGHFNIFRIGDCISSDGSMRVSYSRRDFYKVGLVTGHNLYHYADKSVEITGPTLTFFSPLVPYAWEPLSTDINGYFFIFRESFFTQGGRNHFTELPMFQPGGKPFYVLNDTQKEELSQLFEKMLLEIKGDYAYKYDLLRNYAMEVIHYALKMQPSETLYQHANANTRLTAVFSELLERQFPIETPSQRLGLKSAGDFATNLSVHVNHLNRAVRETTGKTTSTHIAERVATEARALLKHTNWNISEISYCLGFEEPAHFNNFFKKHTHQTPSAFRVV
ncbi:MAG TPA: helix-turn-helix transcriptional regulator [Chitinophaga sp.]|uniref:helix-turn-helix domain-containing protein n=1 Tax=Chitinophaga sp. TaxID=1869181 RepID=UPI002BBAF13F|nr:helix-turn-helix transcriptional regulator [Chitinophaga sp.]HVI44022.1 helix-turn-helix transcriptional regulator [Chitinophaga sp.]